MSLSSASDITANLGSAAENAQKFGESVNKLRAVTAEAQDASKLANAAEEASTLLSGLGAAAGALGAVGAVLGVAAALSGGPSEEDQILNTVKEIDSKVDNLQDLIVAKFDQLPSQIQEGIQKSLQSKQAATITNLTNTIDRFRQATSAQAAHDIVANQLSEFKLTDITLFGTLTVKYVCDKDSYFDTLYQTSCGNWSQIFDEGMTVVQNLMAAQSAFAFLASWKDGKALDAATLEQESGLGAQITQVGAKLSALLNTCVTNAPANVEKFVNQKRMTMHGKSQAQAEADTLRQDLAKQWPAWEWTVIVYDTVRGWDKHGFYAGTGIIKHWFHGDPGNDAPLNLVVHGMPGNHVPGAASPGSTEAMSCFVGGISLDGHLKSLSEAARLALGAEWTELFGAKMNTIDIRSCQTFMNTFLDLSRGGNRQVPAFAWALHRGHWHGQSPAQPGQVGKQYTLISKY